MTAPTSRIMSSALGDIPFDLVLKNANYVNVFTEEIYEADIGVADGRVAHVTQPGGERLSGPVVFDCGGRYVIPGLIDTHVHMESAMLTPANFARTIIPHGTTTVLADPHEICNVLGLEGMDFCVKATRDILLRVYLAAPSCVPSVLGVESNKMTFNAPEIAHMLAYPEVLTLGEVMDYPGVIKQNPRMMAILAEAKKVGKLIQGHVIDVSPRQLSAYMAAGVCSDHESRTLEDVLVKLRAGMWVECRYGSNAQNVPMEAEALAMLGYPVNATLCTDDREADDLLRIGQLDEAVRQAIKAGVPPVKAVQMATRNAALFLGLHDIGGLRPGAWADIVVLDDWEKFQVGPVFIAGRLAAEKGKLVASIPASATGFEDRNTMQVKGPLALDDFRIAAEGERVKLSALSFKNGDPFEMKLKQVEFPVDGGWADVQSLPEWVMMAVVERHNATGNIGLAPAENIGLTRGAVAGTVAHDSHNLFIFGKNPADMLVAANRLIEIGGGFVAVEGGKVLSEVPLPVCGLLSLKPVEELARDMEALKNTVNALGIAGHAPVHMLTWFCLAVLPEARLTDMGLIDTINQKPIPRYG